MSKILNIFIPKMIGLILGDRYIKYYYLYRSKIKFLFGSMICKLKGHSWHNIPFVTKKYLCDRCGKMKIEKINFNSYRNSDYDTLEEWFQGGKNE